MRLRVLGAAAGGGLPQWNCACRNCDDARKGVLPRATQSSVAVSLDGRDWLVLNASPDIRAQLDVPAFALPGLRGSPVRAVVVTNADVDHIAGLLSLREGTAFDLWASADTHAVLAGSPVFGVMAADVVARRELVPEVPFVPLPGVEVAAFPVPGKVALYLEGAMGSGHRTGGQTVGLRIAAGGRVAFYIPGCAAVPDDLRARVAGADVLFFDGTVFRDDEMAATGTGAKTGARMGHVAMEASLQAWAGVRIGRKVFIHLNNTNPAWQPASPERAAVTTAGWQVAADGMEMTA
ncbi:MAG: pyrroloquinoline quinone biosynthesis protein PqqB [Gemmobacter sp.]